MEHLAVCLFVFELVDVLFIAAEHHCLTATQQADQWMMSRGQLIILCPQFGLKLYYQCNNKRLSSAIESLSQPVSHTATASRRYQ